MSGTRQEQLITDYSVIEMRFVPPEFGAKLSETLGNPRLPSLVIKFYINFLDKTVTMKPKSSHRLF